MVVERVSGDEETINPGRLENTSKAAFINTMNSIKAANQVLQRTSEYLGSGLVSTQPAWYKALAFNSPKLAFNKKIRMETLGKTKAEEVSSLKDIDEKLSNGFYVTRLKASKKADVKSLLASQKLRFLEDDLRQLFYKQHPWELADPKLLIENEANLGNRNCDWSHMRQYGKKLDGESVVQRTLFLKENSDMSLIEAYEEAKYEYYRLKIQDETEMNIAREESEMFGAIYPQTMIEQGFEKESEVLQKWAADAVKQTDIMSAKTSNKDSSATASADINATTEQSLSEDEIFASLGN